MSKRRKMHRIAALAAGVALASLAAVSLAAAPPPPSRVAGALVVASVRNAADRWQPERDPLVRTASGAEAKASNVNGLEVDGVRYYYRLVHGQSFDPKGRGEPGRFVTVTTLDAGTPFELEIYRWLDRE